MKSRGRVWLKGIIASFWEFIDPKSVPTDTIFLLNANLCTLQKHVKACKSAGKKVFVDVDFAEGISSSRAAMEFLRDIGVDGVISVKLNNFYYAQKVGLPFLLRVFALDSRAVEKAYHQVQTNKIKMIEILPGCAALKIGEKFKLLGINVVTGGLVSEEKEAERLLGIVDAVSTSAKNLWRLKL